MQPLKSHHSSLNHYNTGSIEFVGTASEFRGQGVASQIIEHIIETTPYNDYVIEEVADTNTSAMNLYNKLGFEEYKRKPLPEIRAKKIGINNFLSLKYVKK
ncbi:acetyltransferase (GNAT) family protein [Bacillus oleivorans]|uniref:Acetyltransferase (GNAT) family protein n=1 Tax=Bacillus oleivorans TaxID=1448271 RepID=A0A285CPR1_9BACI|nr:N-acetyltransferase [Bacillus oleivorans]SNX69542.1 acetyltransferase (GNAT) family protein [Bacillus oleivorans]